MSIKPLTQKDVALVIPTYNRADDVNRTLRVLIKNKNVPGRIYVVDQSKDDKTKNVCKKYAQLCPVQYVFSNMPSSSRAENIGVRLAKKKYRLILISGDDMDYLPGYMRNMVKEFNEHPKLMGLGGMDVQSGAARHVSRSRLSTFLLNFFFLPSAENHQFRVTGPYGLTSSPEVKRPILDAQWIPGFNNCFRREVYEHYSFPESKGYNVLEDIDCTYTVYKKYGPGSLVITPTCKVWHRESQAARYPPKKRIFVNHEDHFAFYYRHFYTPLGTVKMCWSLLGIIGGNIGRALVRREKQAFLHAVYVVQAVLLAYRNRKNIKNGKFRTFLNDDLSLKQEYA
jgi:GT2 family glycosyltransferase